MLNMVASFNETVPAKNCAERKKADFKMSRSSVTLAEALLPDDIVRTIPSSPSLLVGS